MNEQLMKNIVTSLRELRKETHGLLEEESSMYHISVTQLFILDVLSNDPGLSLHKLSKKIKLSPSTTSEAVEKLVRADMVERCTNEKNRRRVEIYLTEIGKEALHGTYSNWLKEFEVWEQLGEERLLELYNMQKEMTELLKKRRALRGKE